MSRKVLEITPESEFRVPLYHQNRRVYHPFFTEQGRGLPFYEEEGVDSLQRFYHVLNTRLPAPALLPALNVILSNISDSLDGDSNNRGARGFYLRGGPGIGKTEIGIVLAEALGWGCKIIPSNFGGGNFDELIAETRLNTNPPQVIFEEIERALANPSQNQGLINALSSSNLIKKGQDGKYHIDLNILNNADSYQMLLHAANLFLAKQNGEVSPISKVQGHLLELLVEAIPDASLENRDSGDTSNSEKKPTVLIIDELNRYQKLGGAMQTLFEVIKGTRSECYISSFDKHGRPKLYHFKKEDFQDVILIGTGNVPNMVLEPDATELPEATKSRFITIDVPHFSFPDYAHRLGQIMLCMPINTSLHVKPDHIDQGEYISSILAIEPAGAHSKVKNPIAQTLLNSNAANVVAGLDLLGNVFYDIQKILLGEYKDLNSEIRDLKISASFSPRTLNDIYNYSLSLPSHPLLRNNDEASARNIGTRFVNALLYWIDDNIPMFAKDGSPSKIRNKIANSLVRNRVLSKKDAEIFFGQVTYESELATHDDTQPLVEDLINAGSGVDRSADVAAMINLINAAAREKGLVNDDFNSISHTAVLSLMAEYERQAQQDKGVFNPIAVIGMETDQKGNSTFTLTGAPADLMKVNLAGEMPQRTVSLNEILAAVIAEGRGNTNAVLEQLFRQDGYGNHFQAKSIVNGTDENGFHATNLQLSNGKGKDASYVTLYRSQTVGSDGKTNSSYVMVGDKTLPTEVVNHLEKYGIQYIERKQQQAIAKALKPMVKKALDTVFAGLEGVREEEHHKALSNYIKKVKLIIAQNTDSLFHVGKNSELGKLLDTATSLSQDDVEAKHLAVCEKLREMHTNYSFNAAEVYNLALDQGLSIETAVKYSRKDLLPKFAHPDYNFNVNQAGAVYSINNSMASNVIIDIYAETISRELAATHELAMINIVSATNITAAQRPQAR